jgi:hypothetical protein
MIIDDEREEGESDTNHRGPAVRKGAQRSGRGTSGQEVGPAVRKGAQRSGRGRGVRRCICFIFLGSNYHYLSTVEVKRFHTKSKTISNRETVSTNYYTHF